MNYFIQTRDMSGTLHAPAILPLVPIDKGPDKTQIRVGFFGKTEVP